MIFAKKSKKQISSIISFLFEIGNLRKIKRSIRKNTEETVAAHSFRTAVIGYIMAKLLKTNVEKTVLMCLLHDIGETRVGDVDLVNRRYVQIAEMKAVSEATQEFEFGQEIYNLLEEMEQGVSLEARLAKDADILEEMLIEKEYYDQGDPRARDWLNFTLKRLKTKTGKDLSKSILSQSSDNWWYSLIPPKI